VRAWNVEFNKGFNFLHLIYQITLPAYKIKTLLFGANVPSTMDQFIISFPSRLFCPCFLRFIT